MTSLIVILLAAGAMLVQDILGTVMVVAEARNSAHLAAAMDTAGWFVAIWCTTISVTILQGHSLVAKAGVIVAVSAANYAGTYFGTGLGHRLTRKNGGSAHGCSPPADAVRD